MNKKILKVPLYPCRLGVVVCSDEGKVNKYLESQGMDFKLDFDSYYAACFEGLWKNEKGEEFYCVYIVLNQEAELFTHGIVSHEVRHATNAIMQRIGHSLDAINDEPEAYLQQWITDAVYNVLSVGGHIDKLRILGEL